MWWINRLEKSSNFVFSPTWYHLTSNSSSGFLKNPPTSAPTNGMPATDRLSIIGMVIFRCDHSAMLSPVHTAAKWSKNTNWNQFRANNLKILKSTNHCADCRRRKPLSTQMDGICPEIGWSGPWTWTDAKTRNSVTENAHKNLCT